MNEPNIRSVRRRSGSICRICGDKLSERVHVVNFDDSTNLCAPCDVLLVRTYRAGVPEGELSDLVARARENTP